MRKQMTIGALCGLVTLAVFSASCVKESSFYHETGSEIVFGASKTWQNECQTRTEYSGKDEKGELVNASSAYERIDWVPDNDRIRILCEAAEKGPTADYTLTGTPTVLLQKSQAGISPVDGNGLQWGTGDHYFYALYPAAGTESNYSFTSNNPVTEENAVIVPETGDKAKITGMIPAAQEVIKVENEYKANMNYAYMYAATKVSSGTSGNVTLSFKPLVTTLEFSLKALAEDPIEKNLTRVELRSENETLTGSFTATLSTEDTPSIGTSGVLGNTVTIDLPDGGIQLSDTPVKVTFLTLPVNQTKLTLVLYFGSDYATYRTFDLTDTAEETVENPNGWIVIPACKKSYFRLGVHGTILTDYTLDPIGDVILSSAEERFFGAEKEVSVKSYSSSAGSSEGISWKAYALAADGSTFVDHDSDEWPQWLSLSAYSGTGDPDGEALKVYIAENMEVVGTEVSEVSGSMISTLQGTDVVGTADNPRDLSLYDIYGELFITKNGDAGNNIGSITKEGVHTSNCYVVSAPGYYCFPLVYGNGIDMDKGNSEGKNQKAYQGTNGTRYFYNADNEKIEEPFILNDINSTGPFDAVVLWQDVLTGSEILLDEDITVVDAPSGAGLPNCKYIQFHIKNDRILPGNIVIALRDKKNDNRIIWSWHIWVTTVSKARDNDNFFSLQAVKYRVGSDGITNRAILNCNLGWTPPLIFQNGKTIGRETTVKIVPDSGTAPPVTFLVQQPELELSYIGKRYSNTFYQWGRKDPFDATIGDANVSRVMTSKQYRENITALDLSLAHKSTISNVSFGRIIQEPHHFYKSAPQMWDSQFYLWSPNHDTRYTGYSANASNLPLYQLKSVYDPSPAGFCVPLARIWTGFTSDGGNKSSAELYNGTNFTSSDNVLPDGKRFTKDASHNSSTYTLKFYFTGARYHKVVENVNVSGTHWMNAQSKDDNNHYPFFLDFGSSWVNPLSYGANYWMAYSIRPVVE